MPRLFIDNQPVDVPDGATILDAARALGVAIPTMCFLEGRSPLTSCMLCVVKVEGADRLVPSCAAPAVEGMRVESETSEVHEARRTALELLLGDHLGDCEAPCQIACPAHMDIPRMIRQIRAGKLREAIATVKEHIALPATLGRICPAPCEKACRRGAKDEPVAICLLKRYAADVDLEAAEQYVPACERETGKRIAIVGAGSAGLAAAYYLTRLGHGCVVFEGQDCAGGKLLRDVPEDKLPRDVLAREVAIIEKLGVEIRLSTTVGSDVSFDELREQFDAVLIATGQTPSDKPAPFGLEAGDRGITVDRMTYETTTPGVFAVGGAVAPVKMAVRSVAQGRAAAMSIAAYLTTGQAAGVAPAFSTHVGKVSADEIDSFMVEADPAGRIGGAEPWRDPLSPDQAAAEAARCMHCDCRKPDDCKLRTYAQLYGAKSSRFKSDRRPFIQHAQHPQVIYEPGKCIDCGLCVQIAANAKEALGLSFIGRGFDVRVAVPFGESVAQGLQTAAEQCVAACPTGALAMKGD
jgi:NADPH-dependent glutamate synthase beta subunit-like oxidoreductase